MKCVKRCVSFVLALVLSSVSLVPCFANTADAVVDADCSITVYQYTQGQDQEYEVLVPVVGSAFVGTPVTVGSSTPIVPCIETVSPFLFSEDKTLYWSVYPLVGEDFYDNYVDDYTGRMNQSNVPVLRVGRGYTHSGGSNVVDVAVKYCYASNMNLQSTYAPVYRATIPCGNGYDSDSASFIPNGNLYIEYPTATDKVLWDGSSLASGDKLTYIVEMFQFVDTTDSAILDTLDSILAQAKQANVNLSNILTACNNILNELKALNADTDTMITLLNTLTGLSQSQLTQLENISSSVDAIYYFLTQELKSESDKLTGEAATIGGNIENNAQAEDYYQTSMQGSYDSLDLDNFTFGGIAGAMEFVGTVFSDMWSAFGEYTILFTYPMILGIALLVIGRISKHGGGNSSRSSEHKGGEGGA